MAKNEEHLNLLFNVDDNIDDIIDKMQNMEDHVEGLDKMFSDFAKKGPKESMAAMAEMEDHIFEMNRGVNNLQKNFNLSDKLKEANVSTKDLMASMGEMSDIQVELEELTNDRINANTEAEKQAIDEIIAKRKDQFAKTKKMFDKHAKEVTESLQTEQKEMKRVFTDLDEQADETFSNIKQGAGGVFSGMAASLASGDVGGMLEGGGGFFDQALTGIGQKGQAAGEKAGVRMKAGGKGKMGGMVQGLGKFAGAVGKFAAAVGPVAMIASLLMKANAQTQELNKSFTETTPMIKMSADGLGAAEDHLAELRDTATDFATNVRLGLNPQEHMQIIGQLEEHNIMIDELAESYGSYGKAAKEAVESIRVAQLNLGASSQEVGAFMGNMMDIHAQSFERTQKSLTSIVAEAEEAGISSKQFFSTVSQLTGQMGLYNFKLESSVQLLSELNKVMDAENAAEFTKELTHGLKNANSQERLRLMMLNKESTIIDMLAENAKEMAKNLEGRGEIAARLGVGVDELNAKIAEMSQTEKEDALADVRLNMSEEAYKQLDLLMRQVEGATEGGFAAVSAMSDLGGMQNLKLQTGALEAVFNKSIGQIESIEAEAAGIEQQRLRQLQHIEQVMRGNMRMLQAAAKAGDPDQVKKLADRMGVNVELEDGQLINPETEEAIKNQYDLMNTTTDERKDQLKQDAKEQKSAAEKQIEATQSIGDILTNVIADLLNELSGVTAEINSLLYKMFSGASSSEIAEAEMRAERKKAEMEVRRLKEEGADKEKINALEEDIKIQKSMERAVGKGALEEMGGYDEQIEFAKKAKSIAKKSGALGAVSMDKIFESAKQVEKGVGVTTGKYSTTGKEAKATAGLRSQARTAALEELGMTPTQALAPGNKKRYRDLARQKMADIKAAELATQAGSSRFKNQREEILGKLGDKIGDEMVSNKKANEEVRRALEDRGIKIDDQASEKLAKDFVAQQQKAAWIKKMTKAGFSPKDAEFLAQNIGAGVGQERMVKTAEKITGGNMTDGMTAVVKALTTPIVGPRAEDARMVTGGIPFLNLQKGDIIVDETSLAQTMRGSKGAMVPDLMRKAGLSGGGGGGMRQNVNIVINGGDTSKVRQTVMKTLDYINRKKGGK